MNKCWSVHLSSHALHPISAISPVFLLNIFLTLLLGERPSGGVCLHASACVSGSEMGGRGEWWPRPAAEWTVWLSRITGGIHSARAFVHREGMHVHRPWKTSVAILWPGWAWEFFLIISTLHNTDSRQQWYNKCEIIQRGAAPAAGARLQPWQLPCPSARNWRCRHPRAATGCQSPATGEIHMVHVCLLLLADLCPAQRGEQDEEQN